MTNLFRFLFIGLVSFGFSSQVYGKTIADVTSASCTSTKGGYLNVDKLKMQIEGQFGTLDKMVGAADVAVEVIPDYPSEGFTSLGSLVIDAKNYWGNMSLHAPTQQKLYARDTLNAFFTDVEGNYIVETMECDLNF